MLIDAGCELDGYASDITRTWPVNGRFSGPQRALYELVLAAQQAALDMVRPGLPHSAMHEAAVRVLAQGMLDLGLLERQKNGSVHDVIADKRVYAVLHARHRPLAGHGRARRRRLPRTSAPGKPSRALEAGMVLTVEPGIYVRPGAGVPEQFWNIGIRIEDDVLVTPQGHEVFSTAPKTVAEIEQLMYRITPPHAYTVHFRPRHLRRRPGRHGAGRAAGQRGARAARIALIDAKSCRCPARPALDRPVVRQPPDARRGGAWPVPATAIHQIHVSRRGQFGRSLIDRSEHDVPALGYVTRYGELVARWPACASAGHGRPAPGAVTGSAEDADGVSLKLDRPGRASLRASLVVQAEGGVFGQQAGARRHARLPAERGDRPGGAAVRSPTAPTNALPTKARWRCCRRRRRRLRAGVVRAPPSGPNNCWRWTTLPSWRGWAPPSAPAWDALRHATTRLAYPLGLNADAGATARTVAIGNAAQTLHPVAGQGLNLGLRDAAVLARVLAQDSSPAALERYASLRQADRALTVRVTDTMARIFTGSAPTQGLLGVSLGLLDAFSPARKSLATLMMYGRR